jgi:hypothetical protein
MYTHSRSVVIAFGMVCDGLLMDVPFPAGYLRFPTGVVQLDSIGRRQTRRVKPTPLVGSLPLFQQSYLVISQLAWRCRQQQDQYEHVFPPYCRFRIAFGYHVDVTHLRSFIVGMGRFVECTAHGHIFDTASNYFLVIIERQEQSDVIVQPL